MFEKTVEVLKEYVDPDTEITMDSALIDDLGLTSIDVISVVAAFEDEYGFVFEEQEMLREDTEEFPLWSELIEEPEKKRRKPKKNRHRKSRESSWGD